MKILVVGSGGREHALAWKLSQSPLAEVVYCAPGNAGTARDVRNLNIAADDIPRLVKFAEENAIDLTVVGPEAPLVAGITDAFQKRGLLVFGPSAAAARLEGSKVFTKRLLRKANIPTAAFAVFSNFAEAEQYISDGDEQPMVVKADGLAAGKGVFVCANRQEAREAVRSILADRSFGDAGAQVVIEECLVGEEASILAIVDGDTIVPLDVSQDHKRALDGDEGPNTGGMGAYCPAPVVTPEIMDEIVRRVLIPTVHTMKQDGCPFNGVLYAGLMLTAGGPRVLEYNVRFGDPEAQPVLMRLKTDLLEILHLAASGKLDQLEGLEWDPRPAVCVVMASEGYPGGYAKGATITGIEQADQLPDTKVFHAGTALDGDNVVNRKSAQFTKNLSLCSTSV
ncbi:MAG: phosphoribosylamine--glycine ligase, partial [Planctomycetaceae bacterium]